MNVIVFYESDHKDVAYVVGPFKQKRYAAAWLRRKGWKCQRSPCLGGVSEWWYKDGEGLEPSIFMMEKP